MDLAQCAARALLPLALAAAALDVEGAVPSIAGGVRHGAALGSDGRVRTWGDDENGVLGLNRVLYSCPAAVPLANGITQVSTHGYHVLALKGDGTVLAWGDNGNGQLGDGTTTRRSTPVQVSGLSGVLEVSASNGLSMARTSYLRVWEWGGSPVPVRVEGVDSIVEISAGAGFKLARRIDGTVWAWGENTHGQLDRKSTRLNSSHRL